MRLHEVMAKYHALAEVDVKAPRPRPEEKEYPFEGQCEFQGIQIDIENKKGSTRSGTDPSGNKWSIKMEAHYGEIRRTKAPDGDKLDVYVGPNEDAQWVFVIHQQHPKDHPSKAGRYDEDKVILGMDSADAAIALYKAHYDKPDEFFGSMTMISIDRFKAWLRSPKSKGEPVQPPVKWKTGSKG